MSEGHRSPLRLDPHSPGRWGRSAERDWGAVPVSGREQGTRGDTDAPTLHRPDLRAQSPREGMQWQTTARSHGMKTMPEGSYQKVQHLITGFFFAAFFTISQTKQSNNIVKYSIYPQTLEIKRINLRSQADIYTDRRTKHLLPSL